MDDLIQKYSKNFKIAHINANSIAGFKFHEIKLWLLKGTFDVLVITETKLDHTFRDAQLTIDGYRFTRRDRSVHGGGVIIYWRSDLIFNYSKLAPNLSCVEALLIKLKLGNSWLMVCGAYRPPSTRRSIWMEDLYKLFEHALSSCDDLLVLGDLNCDLLQPQNNGGEGSDLLDLCDIFNLECLVNEPTRVTPTSKTLIDVILTNNKGRFLSTGTLEPHISDHRLIYTVMRISLARKRSRKVTCRSYKAYDKERFVSDLTTVPFHITSIFDDIDDQAWAFTKLFSDIANEHAPIKQFHIRGGQLPYMTPEWRRAIRHRNRLWNIYRKSKTEPNWLAYKRQRNLCTSLRRKAITGYFRYKTNNLSSDPREFWKLFGPLFSSKQRGTNDITLLEDDVFITDKQRIAHIFNQFFTHVADNIPEPDPSLYGSDFLHHQSIKTITNLMDGNPSADFCFNNTTPAVVIDIIKSLPASKAIGHDNIPTRLVKDSISILARPLCTLFNSSIAGNCFPTCWKSGQVTPVFKKDTEYLKENYRPITVLVTFSNIMERILSQQLVNFFEEKLSPYLSAYRRNYSCQTALLRILEELRIACDHKSIAAIVGIELTKAFDCLPHELLLAKLKSYGLSSGSLLLLRSYLTDRFQRVKIGDTFSDWTRINKGVPQGSVLGPLLFNIFINDLLHISRSSEINTYADDTQFFTSGQDPHTIQLSMQADLQSASKWFQSNGMGLNVNKCLSMWVGSNSEDLALQLRNRNLQLSSSMKLLGITIDNALTFHEHVSDLVRKVSNQLQVLKRHKRLIPTGAKKRLYVSFILPHLNYCSVIWLHCGKKNVDKLEKINERCLCFVFNDFHSTYDELLDHINQPSLQDRRIHDMLTLTYRALNGNAPVYIKSSPL